MSKDQLLGVLILLGAIAVLGVYGFMIVSGGSLQLWALLIVATVAVVGVIGIIAWIGWTMATTPPPTPMEGLEENITQQTSTEEKIEEKKE